MNSDNPLLRQLWIRIKHQSGVLQTIENSNYTYMLCTRVYAQIILLVYYEFSHLLYFRLP